MLVSQVLAAKGGGVFTTTPAESVESVAIKLWTRRVGSLVVLDSAGDVIGIVSERDILRVIAESGGAGLGRPIGEVMSREVVVATPADTVDAMLALITDRRIRHLPVCQDHQLVGIISIGDLVKSRIAESEAETEHLRAYIAS